MIDIYLKLFLYIIYSNNNDLQILKKFIKFRTKYKRKLIDNKIISPYKANVTSYRDYSTVLNCKSIDRFLYY